MKRGAPLKRVGFKRKAPLRQSRREGADVEREPKPRAPSTVQPLHRGTYASSTSSPAPKANMLKSAAYENAVRDLGYCMRCRCACRPQFCHRDETKGMGIKTDVREGWPGCAECHWILGASGQYPREEKRALELEFGRRTREAVKAAGTWPARLPMWTEA